MSRSSEIVYIGYVSSELQELKDCPKQGYEGAPAARVHIDSTYHDALLGIKQGTKIVLLTWLDQADRSILQVHPRHNPKNPLTGVFLTRSPSRPNPIGLHEVEVKEVVEPGVLVVEPLEVLDNTPVIDIKLFISKRRVQDKK